MAKAKFQKYQTLFKVIKTDEDGEPVKVLNEQGQMRTQYIDAPDVHSIPDWMHRGVTEAILEKLQSDGQVRFSDIESKMGAAFTNCRLDYIKRWIEAHSEIEGNSPIELIYVNSKYWTAGKGDSRSDDLEIAQSYLSVNGRDKKGWVVSGENEEGNEQITRARISWQVGMADKLLTHVHNKLADGSGKSAEVKAAINAATGTLSAIESK